MKGSIRPKAGVGVRELPESLPSDEQVLWQGGPNWASLFRQAFFGRTVAIYLALMVLVRGLASLGSGNSVLETLITMARWTPVAALGVGMVALLAWLSARASWYTITDRRVIMRIGIVPEITFNFPFKAIGSAQLRQHADRRGDITMALQGDDHIAYLHLWPHVRPFRFTHTEPMLRSLDSPERVAALLAQAIAQHTGGTALEVQPPAQPDRAEVMHGPMSPAAS